MLRLQIEAGGIFANPTIDPHSSQTAIFVLGLKGYNLI